jgi:DNA-binding Lrp family transcriptional regulator
MSAIVEIDETDKKILQLLIKDARAKLKDIAKDCGISSVAVLNRIKHLKTVGVITGATLFPRINLIGIPIVATIGIELDSNEEEVIKLIGEQTNLVEPSTAVGKYDLCALVFAETIAELDKAVYAVRKSFGVRKATVNIWVGEPHLVFENLDLQPKEFDKNGQV